MGNIPYTQCIENITAPTNFSPKLRADLWWYCGEDKLYDQIPTNSSGTCALISLLLPVFVRPMETDVFVQTYKKFSLAVLDGRNKHRGKRDATVPAWLGDDYPVYIDSIGQPRNIPNEYKWSSEIAAGFENLPFIHAFIPNLELKTQKELTMCTTMYNVWVIGQNMGLQQCMSSYMLHR